MKIDLKVKEHVIAGVEIPEKLMTHEWGDLSVVPLVCGMAIGVILPFGLMALMKELLSCEVTVSAFGVSCLMSPRCAVALIAVVASTVVIIWIMYILWKKWRMENDRKWQKQSLDFVSGMHERILKHMVFVLPKEASKSEASKGDNIGKTTDAVLEYCIVKHPYCCPCVEMSSSCDAR